MVLTYSGDAKKNY